MKRIAVLIERSSSFKVLAPLVDRAILEGLDVWLVLNDEPSQRASSKAYDHPDPARIPMFRNGTPCVLRQTGFADVARLCRDSAIEAIFSLGFDPSYFPKRHALREMSVRWVAIQHASDMFAYPPSRSDLPDLYCVYTEEWARIARSFFGRFHSEDALGAFAVTGAPELDSLRLISPAEVRRKLGLAADVPIVTWLPHDVHPADLWEILRYRGGHDIRAVVGGIRSRRWDLLAGLLRPSALTVVMSALRRFCDDNGAALVTKSRIKDKPERLEREIADVFTYDVDSYPPTILELLAVSRLCVHVFSHVSLEAAALNVSSISLAPPPDSAFMDATALGWRVAADGGASIWDFPGVNSIVPIEDAARAFAARPLAEFAIDPAARAAYLARFVGPVDGDNSGRVLRAAAAITRP